MAKLNRRSISRRTVEALKVEKDTVFLGIGTCRGSASGSTPRARRCTWCKAGRRGSRCGSRWAGTG